MKVILHADDFGFNEDSCKATIECLEKGALSSATIMVNCEASNMALDYAKNHPEKSFGVHLTYVDELTPVSAPNHINSLVDKNGVFLSSAIISMKALRFGLSTKEVIKETLAQIEKMKNAGCNISHLDSHGHMHKFPQMLSALTKIKMSNPGLRVRRVQNVFVEDTNIGPTKILNALLDSYISHTFLTTEYFYMPANHFDVNWSDAILTKMDNLPQDSTIEIGVHPGHKEEWRQHEYDDIIDFATKLRASEKHQIINWNQI